MSLAHLSKAQLQKILLASSLTLSALTLYALPVLAADGKGCKDSSALDESIWMDNSQTKGSSQNPKAATDSGSAAAELNGARTPPVDSSTAPEPGRGGSAGKDLNASRDMSAGDEAAAGLSKFSNTETRAPMCSLDNFKASALVQKGGWPGVGPFKSASNPLLFVDDNHNQLKIEVEGDKVTKAELHLAGKKPGSPFNALLDMQMTVDFLLESVGIKPKRIADLNSQLEKRKDLLERDPSSVSLTTGRFSVAIDKRPSPQNQSDTDYIIAVNSLEASKQAIKGHSLAEDSHAVAAVQHPSIKQPKESTAQTSLTKQQDLKDDFVNLIRTWQKIKKTAVRMRQTEELTDVLAGNALAKQTDAVKWLTDHHKYYDMTPRGVVVDKYAEISPARKYLVAAQVREAYKYVDDISGQVLKESDDTYKVNYTVEKIGSHWAIIDSSLVSTTTQVSKTQATKTH